MTAMLDYDVFPPELNSARMYAGPGSGSMLTAASAWDDLAADLRAQAANFGSVVEGLTGGGWQGPSSTSMAAAAAPYMAWMNTTATQAEQTAAQAKSAAVAYETAISATVPPPMIAANRAQLASLVATNVLGQNTPAIMTNEANYAEMWAQDAGAMNGYAGQSAAATQLTMFSPPAQTTNSAALSGQSAALNAAIGTSAGTGVQANVSSGVSTSSSGLSAILSDLTGDGSGSGLFSSSGLGLNNNLWNTVSSTGAFNPAEVVQAVTGSSFLGAGTTGMTAGLGSSAAVAQGIPSLSGLGGSSSAISAGVGKAATLGPLSVPPAWTSIATPNSPLVSALGTTPLGAPQALQGLPGMPVPANSNTANTAAASAPKYGFRSSIIMRSPMAG
jgi:PPE-repeat protein